jgi:undecaprenyl phosphate-alpha-L-ara4N flippase subunit ArnF
MSRLPRSVIGVVLLATSIVLSATGQLGMKVGMVELHAGVPILAPHNGLLGLLSEPLLWTAGGLLAYGLSLIAWLGVLVRYPLSYAYPFLSLSYVLVYVAATQWSRLAEMATPLRSAGTLLILVGVCLVSLTGRRAAADQR